MTNHTTVTILEGQSCLEGQSGADAERARRAGAVALDGGWALAADVAVAATEALIDAVGTGVAIASARVATGLDGDVADALIATVEREGRVVRQEARVVLPGQIVADPAAESVARILSAAGLRPPGLVELREQTGLPAKRLAAVLAELRTAGSVVAAGDLWFEAHAVAGAVDLARVFLAEGPKGIGELRDLWGVGRRHALALAAHLDAGGITRRVGDTRVLRRGAASTSG